MNPGNSEPRQVAGEPSLQGGHRANKRRRHDQKGQGDANSPQEKATTGPFECPFCKNDPHQYPECRGLKLTRLYDVIQHIKRQHLLVEVTIGSQADLPEDVTLYCPRCRCLFRGQGAVYRLEVHLNQNARCQPVSIGQSGFMRSKELKELKDELGSGKGKGKSEKEKWFIIWDKCFPGKDGPPPSPYVEISVPRLQVESILRDELVSIQSIQKEEVQSFVRRCADRIYKSLPDHRSSSSVPLRAQLQTAHVQNYDTPAYMSSNPAFTSQPSQPQTQCFGYGSGIPHAGVHATPNANPRDNLILWNHDTFTDHSAPSPAPGFGVHNTSENNNVDSEYDTAPDPGYPLDPYVGYPTASMESTSQDNDYSNTYGNIVN